MTVLARAARATRARPDLWIVALGGFLARGGIVLLVLPMVPLPSTVGLATFIGPTSVTAAGLTQDAIVRLVVVVALAVAWLLAGSAVGAMADVALIDGSGPAVREGRPAGVRLVVRLVALRLVALVPLAVVLAIVARGVGELVYQELTLPRDVAAPLVLRVVEGAQVQVAAIAIAWIAGEVLGGVAVRLAIVEGRPFGRAVLGALAHLVRHPVSTLAATVAGVVGLIVAVFPGLVVAGTAWDALGHALSGAIDDRAIVGLTIVLVAAWVGWATLAAILAAFRAAVWTAAVARSS